MQTKSEWNVTTPFGAYPTHTPPRRTRQYIRRRTVQAAYFTSTLSVLRELENMMWRWCLLVLALSGVASAQTGKQAVLKKKWAGTFLFAR